MRPVSGIVPAGCFGGGIFKIQFCKLCVFIEFRELGRVINERETGNNKKIRRLENGGWELGEVIGELENSEVTRNHLNKNLLKI